MLTVQYKAAPEIQNAFAAAAAQARVMVSSRYTLKKFQAVQDVNQYSVVNAKREQGSTPHSRGRVGHAAGEDEQEEEEEEEEEEVICHIRAPHTYTFRK
jgi:hypothetical protein